MIQCIACVVCVIVIPHFFRLRTVVYNIPVGAIAIVPLQRNTGACVFDFLNHRLFLVDADGVRRLRKRRGVYRIKHGIFAETGVPPHQPILAKNRLTVGKRYVGGYNSLRIHLAVGIDNRQLCIHRIVVKLLPHQQKAVIIDFNQLGRGNLFAAVRAVIGYFNVSGRRQILVGYRQPDISRIVYIYVFSLKIHRVKCDYAIIP